MAKESALKQRYKDPRSRTAEDDCEAHARERRMVEDAQRDPRRFAALYEEHFERVYAFIVRRVGDREQAEDLTADVFHNALRSLGRYEWRGAPFAAWLFRIAANALIDRGKRARLHEAVLNATVVPSERSSEAAIEEAERRARLFRMVNKLPPSQRRVIVMRFAEQKSIGEIAAESGRSEGAIKQLQFRALQSLRAVMGER